MEKTPAARQPAMLASALLRTGLIAVFLYAAIASLVEPDAWIGYLPAFARDTVPAPLLISLFSAYQILLSIWLFSNRKIMAAAIVSALTVAGIIVVNVGILDVVFRDVAILFAALALAAIAA